MNDHLTLTGEQLSALINQLQDLPYRFSAPVLNYLQYLIDMRNEGVRKTAEAPALPEEEANA